MADLLLIALMWLFRACAVLWLLTKQQNAGDAPAASYRLYKVGRWT